MLKKATFAGGCFWCTEAIFQELKGVESVESGYGGGFVENPKYYDVCRETTGHAEAIEVDYNDSIISFEDLVIVHMTTHNPMTLNQQGADRGTQYRSIVFYRNEEEKAIIEEVFSKLKPLYEAPIITEIKAFETFYIAETEHQDFYKTNTEQPYCQFVIDPKLAKFRKMHAEKLK